MKIDAHQHFWQYDPTRDQWMTDDMKKLRSDYMPDDLGSFLKSHQIEGCVAVQADQSEAETDFLLGLADNHDFIKGVVGWLDLSSDLLPEKLEHYSNRKKLKGLRHIVQGEQDGFMVNNYFLNGVKTLASYDLTYDLLIYERQLEEAVTFIKSLPEMKIVIDHIAKPNIKEKSFDHWANYMSKIASMDHVYVKLSGMVTEANWHQWTQSDIQQYVDFCLEHFGAKRLMYGSDWPVCLLAGTYSEVYGLLNECISQLSNNERKQILGLNAIDFYQLKK